MWRYDLRDPAPGETSYCQPNDCPTPLPAFVVNPGGTFNPRPTGSVLRLQLIYQGSALGVVEAKGIATTLAPADGPFQPGTNSGYWAELRDGADHRLFTRLLRDPTRMEVAGPDGGFAQILIPKCSRKPIPLDVPNDPLARVLIVFGSPYGTQGGAVEIARFSLP